MTDTKMMIDEHSCSYEEKIMVEMRWIGAHEAVSHDSPCFKTEGMVLQFRYYKDPEMPIWSEWIDVPTVSDERRMAMEE